MTSHQAPSEINKQRIVTIISMFYPDASIYLFGSRARGDHTETSDIDIAIDAGKILSSTDYNQIKNMITALNIPQKVDVVDMHAISLEMQEIINKEKVIWKK